MKRKSLIISIMLVLALALSGVAYAAWTDQLFINGTVATGNMDVVYDSSFLCDVNHYPNVDTSNFVEAEASYSADKKTCTFTVENLYPGAWALIDVKQKNVGTIPVKFDKATLSIGADADSQALMGYLKSKGAYVHYQKAAFFPSSFGFLQGGLFSYGNFTDLGASMTSALQGKVLQPGGWVAFDDENAQAADEPNCIVIKLDKNAPNDLEGKTLTFTLQMDWEQFNS